MPDYTITVKSQSTYGPYTYPDPAALKADFLAGKLPLEEAMAEEFDCLTGVAVKEVKEKVQKGLF